MIASKLWVLEWAHVGDAHGVNFDVRLTNINQFGSHLLFLTFSQTLQEKFKVGLNVILKSVGKGLWTASSG